MQQCGSSGRWWPGRAGRAGCRWSGCSCLLLPPSWSLSCTSAFQPDNMPTMLSTKMMQFFQLQKFFMQCSSETMTVFGHHVQIVLLVSCRALNEGSQDGSLKDTMLIILPVPCSRPNFTFHIYLHWVNVRLA